jgi:hypothetical protein
MKVSVFLPDMSTSSVYLEGMGGYVNKKCEPKITADNFAEFELSLLDFYDCGIMRVVNKITVRIFSAES